MSALLKLLTGLVEGLLAKLGLLLLALEHALQRVLTMLDNDLDVWLPLLARLAGDSDLARETFVHWLLLVWQALSRYWLALLLVLGLALLLVAIGHGPLLWRALWARRRRLFVSFQNHREREAEDLQAALGRAGFRVLRMAYRPGAGHQQVVVGVNELLRRADAMVCLPGRGISFVEGEVAAATFAHKPVVFLVPQGGTVPNTADKRHPVFSQERSAGQGHAPVIEFLHLITQDFASARVLYRRAWRHPAVGLALGRVLLALMLLALLLFGVALVHGGSVIPEADLAALPDARRLRWTAVLLMAVPLLLGAVLLLPLATWLVLVARSLWKQLGAARRAALRVRSGEFARADWVDVVPGMRPGQPLYEALLVAAPRAHHEAVAGPGR